MALVTNELFQSNSRDPAKRIVAKEILPKQFASGTGTIPAGALVAFDTSLGFWAPWSNAGANGRALMKGIAWPDPIELDAGGEVLGQVMLRGSAHRDDIELNGETQGDVDTELQEEARNLGIDIQGLTGVR